MENRIINYNSFHVEQKKLVFFGPLTLEIMWLMFPTFKSTVRFSCMRMHLTLGHVTLLLVEFQLREFFSQ